MKTWNDEMFGGLKHKMENNLLMRLIYNVKENRTLS